MENLRIYLSAILGALIAIGAYMSWFFGITHHDPWNHASPAFMAGTAVFCAIFALVGSLIARAAGSTVQASHIMATILFVFYVWNIWQTWRQFSTFWAPIIAILFMVPAAWLGGHRRAS